MDDQQGVVQPGGEDGVVVVVVVGGGAELTVPRAGHEHLGGGFSDKHPLFAWIYPILEID